MRHLQFQHHDGDDDGQDAIAEGFESRFSHIITLPSVAGYMQNA